MLLGLTVTAVTGSFASAQSYPEKPIRVVVPYAAGGVADGTSRLFAQVLEKELGQPIVIENKPGGGGRIGAQAVSRMAPDGYTLLMTTNGTHTFMAATEENLPYDPLTDFTPISLLASYGFLMVTNPSTVPAKTVPEFIEYAKQNPAKLNYASSGPGSGPHFSGEVFKAMTGIEMTHVPYKGTGPGILAVVAGEVDLIFAADANTFIDSGRLNLLGTTSGKRDPRYPDAPTLDESGLKGYDIISWVGFFGPPGLDPAVQDRLSKAVKNAIKDEQLLAQLAQRGLVPVGNTPDELTELMKAETAKLREVADTVMKTKS